MSRIAGILGVVCLILVFVVSYTFKKINTLETEKNALKNEICKKEQTIKEMEKINMLYQEASKENEKFREELNNDHSDNLDVVPSAYILNRMHKD